MSRLLRRLIGTFALLACGSATLFAQGAGGTEQVLYTFTFTNQLDGEYPSAVIFDGEGNLYGVTSAGGTNPTGAVFELTPGSGGWSENILYSFGPFEGNDGDQPVGALVFDAAGDLYGTTQYGGGSANCGYGCGTVFELTPGTSGWTESVLHRFVGKDGENPCAQLAFDAAGNLYGTTRLGGAHGAGTVFKLSPISGGRWKETLVHSFAGGTDGEDPVHGGVAIDAAGNLYGTTFYGGRNGAGTVFKLTFASGKWKKSILHGFVRGSGIGGYPEAGVTVDGSGNVYGTVTQGGAAGTGGGVFKLKPAAGGKYTYSILHSFRGASDGDFPSTAVVLDESGNLYGTTNEGGTDGDGTVYKLTPTAKGPWKEAILHSFAGGNDGVNPNTTPLLLDAADNIYGSTNAGGDGGAGAGVIFEVSP
jgi:uncharacterized repeat protein (TIGR03803 family)